MSSPRELYRAILSLGSLQECERFFKDLCTQGELEAMADRWQVARLLDKGVSYREIYERTGVSTATVTRVARSLIHGESGYRNALDREAEKNR